VSQTLFGGPPGTCSSNSTDRSTIWLLPPPPPCAAVGLALQIHPLGTIRQGFHIQATPVPGNANQCRRRFGATWHMQLKFYRSTSFCSHHHVLRWDWHLRSTLWYHKTRLSHQTTHTVCRDATSVADVVSHHAVRAPTVPLVPPPPPCAAVGLAPQIHPLP
jgi:hypothetical protein